MDTKKQNIKNFFFSILLILIAMFIISLLLTSDNIKKIILWFLVISVFVYLLFRLKIILKLKDYERAVVFRFGKFNRVSGPGWCIILPGIESANKISLRIEVIDIPPQNVLTKDNIQLTIDGLLYLSVKSDRKSVMNSVLKVKNYKKAATLYVIAMLRDVIGGLELSEVITNIEEINKKLKVALENVSLEWGIKVSSVEIREIKIPKDILEAMHRQKAAIQDKLSVFEFAESEKAKIKAIKDVTDNLSEKTVIYYYIKALEKMAEGKSTKIIFPMEVTNILEKISSKMLKDKSIKSINKLANNNKLEKYLPLIKGYLDNNKKTKKSKTKKN